MKVHGDSYLSSAGVLECVAPVGMVAWSHGQWPTSVAAFLLVFSFSGFEGSFYFFLWFSSSFFVFVFSCFLFL
jgi:hypothetical protein